MEMTEMELMEMGLTELTFMKDDAE